MSTTNPGPQSDPMSKTLVLKLKEWQSVPRMSKAFVLRTEPGLQSNLNFQGTFIDQN
jgi:hypothetical protein